jgi:hypothetical protein
MTTKADEGAVLAEFCRRSTAHVPAFTNVCGRSGFGGLKKHDPYEASCSCGTWYSAQATWAELHRGLDRHLAAVYADWPQRPCASCGRLAFESPLVPGVWVHLNHMHEFLGHDASVREAS